MATGVVVAGSTKLSGAIVKYWTVIAIIIGIIFVATVLSAGNATFITNFNALYNNATDTNAYQSVITAGQANYGSYPGIPPVLSRRPSPRGPSVCWAISDSTTLRTSQGR